MLLFFVRTMMFIVTMAVKIQINTYSTYHKSGQYDSAFQVFQKPYELIHYSVISFLFILALKSHPSFHIFEGTCSLALVFLWRLVSVTSKLANPASVLLLKWDVNEISEIHQREDCL